MDASGTITAAAIAGFVAIVVALLTAIAAQWGLRIQFKNSMNLLDEQIKEQGRVERDREIYRSRLKYLSPLRIAAEDIRDNLRNILARFDRPDQLDRLVSDFGRIKDGSEKNGLTPQWYNDDGHDAASTLYSTAVYFACAGRIRTELPFFEFGAGDEEALLRHISSVRECFSGTSGIWELLQDSIGSYVRREDGGVINYREFCRELMDSEKQAWYLRLLDFYKNARSKKEDFERIQESLDQLISYIKTRTF